MDGKDVSARAELVALAAELEAMKAENAERESRGEALAYGEDAFLRLAGRAQGNEESTPTVSYADAVDEEERFTFSANELQELLASVARGSLDPFHPCPGKASQAAAARVLAELRAQRGGS